MKKMQEAELRVVKFELNDVIVASFNGGTSCYSDTALCTSNTFGCSANSPTNQSEYRKIQDCGTNNCDNF